MTETQEIRINKDDTSIVYVDSSDEPIIRKETFNTVNCLKEISYNNFNDILPQNCKYYTNEQQMMLFVIEEPPMLRTIRVTMDQTNVIEKLKIQGKFEKFGYNENQFNNTNTFKLSFPYVIYFILLMNDLQKTYIRTNVFFRLSPIKSLSDYLLIPNLLNINRNQELCLGEIYTSNEPKTCIEKCSDLIQSFWSSKFNPDYINNYNLYTKKDGCTEISDYLSWQYYSKIDPLFIFKINWHKYDKNIYSVINDFKLFCQSYYPIRKNSVYSTFIEMIKTKNKINNDKSFVKRKASSIYLDGIELSEGDSIPFKSGKEVYVVEPVNDNHTHTLLDVGDNKLVPYKLTKKFTKYILEKYKPIINISQATLPNGQLIKPNDILEIKSDYYQILKKVRSFRKGIDDDLEVSFFDQTNDYYIINKINANIFDYGSLKVGDRTLNKNDIISFYEPTYYAFVDKITTCKIIDFDLAPSDLNFHVKVENLNNKRIETYEYNSFKLKKFLNENMEFKQGIFRLGFYLYKGNYAINNNQIYVANEVFMERNATYEDIKNGILLNNDQTISIPSYNFQLNFNVGDKVVTENWLNPIEMLKTKTINKIIADDVKQTFSFELIDKNGTLSNETYIENSFIKVNSIRKITHVWEGIQAGSKIISKISGIKNFPKKDVNIIVGFLYDTGIDKPLVLCSNCCTIWFDDLINNFEIIEKTNPKWEKLTHANIDTTKIKIQEGDIIRNPYSKEPSYIVVKSFGFLRLLPISSLFSGSYCYRVNHKQFYGILNPRLSGQELQTKVHGIPNLHGCVDKNDILKSRLFSFSLRNA